MPFYGPVAKFCTTLFPRPCEQRIQMSSDAHGVKSQVTQTNRENQPKVIHTLAAADIHCTHRPTERSFTIMYMSVSKAPLFKFHFD